MKGFQRKAEIKLVRWYFKNYSQKQYCGWMDGEYCLPHYLPSCTFPYDNNHVIDSEKNPSIIQLQLAIRCVRVQFCERINSQH